MNAWYITEYRGDDGLVYAGPLVWASSEEAAQAMCDRFARAGVGSLITVVGRLVPSIESKPETSNLYVDPEGNLSTIPG